jgi:lysophospholipase L1-like esterase
MILFARLSSGQDFTLRIQYYMYRFQIIAHTKPGESIGIIGSAPEMGGWDITQCLRLQTSPDHYPVWWADTEIALAPGQHPEYKYVYIQPNGYAEWEGFGFNRWLPVGPEAPDATIVVDDGAFGYLQPYPFSYPVGPLTPPAPPTVNSGLKIAVIGSSVAQGHRAWMLHGWAEMLAEHLQEQGHHLVNRSELGANVQRTIDRFPAVVTPEQPDIVIISLSLGNEGLAHCGGINAQRLAQRRFETGLQQLVKMTRELGAYPILGGVYPHGDYQAEHYAILQETQKRMLAWGVPILDWLAAVDDGQGRWRSGLSFDPAHPNTIGHQRMYEAIDLDLFAIDKPKIAQFHQRIQQQEVSLYRDEAGFQLSTRPQQPHLRINNPSPYRYTIAPYWQELQTVLRQKAKLTPGIYIAKNPQPGIRPYFVVANDGTIETTFEIPIGADLEYQATFEYLGTNQPQRLFYDGNLGIFRDGDQRLWIINESAHEFNIHPMWREICQALKSLPHGVYQDPLDPDAELRTLMIGDRGLASRVKAPARSAIMLAYKCPLSEVGRVAIVPIGARCSARMLLYKLGYDGPAYPYDLTRTTNLGDIADMVINGFDDMWNPAYLHYNAIEKRIYHGKWSGLSFAHEVEDDEDPTQDMQPVYQRMQKRYQARAARFEYTINQADKLLFVRHGFADRAGVIDLMEKLAIKCGGKTFRLLLISPQPSEAYADLPNVVHYNMDVDPDRMYADADHWWEQAGVMREMLRSLGVSSQNLFWCPPNV